MIDTVSLTDSLLSHIFCDQCSEQLGLLSRSNVHKACPACQTILTNPDDAVSTQLNPTEDYKTSVLSGLNPTTVVECAGRGLAFWSYQCSQEMSESLHPVLYAPAIDTPAASTKSTLQKP